jgi:hypothetical protein
MAGPPTAPPLGVVNGLVATSTGFPKAPNKLSGELPRPAPALERVGVRVTLGRSRHGSKVPVEQVGGGDAGPSAGPATPPPLPPGSPAGRGILPGPHDETDDAGEWFRPPFRAIRPPWANRPRWRGDGCDDR